MADADTHGASVYADYIAAQIDREEERKKSLESRGVTVITSSGTLATLLLGLTALSTKQNATFALPHSARWPLALTLVAFTFAAVGALLTNLPLKYREASVTGLRGIVDSSFNDAEFDALQKVAKNRLTILASAKRLNAFKGWALVAAMACETVAIAFLVWAMLEIV